MNTSTTSMALNPEGHEAPPDNLNLVLDRAVIKAIPITSEIVAAEPHGNSFWSATGRIKTRNPDGTTHDYFVKIVEGDLADQRVLGEYSCMLELHKTMPSIVPTPRGFGPCLDSDGHFFLSDYLSISHCEPSPLRLAQRISELHRRSVSPTGQFCFHVTPYDGKLPLEAAWDSSWAGGLAILDLILQKLGTGWTFTVFAILGLLSVPWLYVLQIKGLRWRRQS